jgi:Predicted nucleic-acid-binding protein implicated in transcription termination
MKQKKIPQRMCVGCQSMKTKKELLRVVRTPDGEILLDPSGKKAGRGAYVCPNEECLTKAVKAKRLEKALEHAVSEEVFAALRAGLKQP